MGILLFILALLLSAILLPLGFAYATIKLFFATRFKTWAQQMSNYFFVMAICIDQMGNVVMGELFNDVLIKKYGHCFSNPDETLSSVIGKNKGLGTLTLLGRLVATLLNVFEKDHCEKAIEIDELNKVKT